MRLTLVAWTLWALAGSALGQSWLVVDVGQKLPSDWSWSAKSQLRTPAENMWRWDEGLVDVGLTKSLDAVPGLAVTGQWRTGWQWPQAGGWTMGWRWATSARWKTDVGDHALGVRIRHQFGGAWMRPWDRARWRAAVKWTHDLPSGWKLVPSGEFFLGREGGELVPQAWRGRLALDKKLSKRRHLVLAYQAQAPIQGKPEVTEHTVILALDVALKKVKRQKKDEGLR